MMVKIDNSHLLDLATRLVRIQSENPPGREKEIADMLEEKMAELGLKVERYDFKPGRPNLIGVRDFGSGRSMMFDGHMDTVPAGNPDLWSVDPFSGEIVDGELYGRGSADMKASIAAWLSAVEAVLKAGLELEGKILTCLVSDEEASGLGTRDVLSKGYRADMAVVGEPTGLALNIAHKGVIRWRLATFGRAAHASSPREGVNAIYKMAKACLRIQDYLDDLGRSRHGLVGRPTISIGKISGGQKDNVIPDYCEVTVDRRMIPGEKPEEAEREFVQLLESMKQQDKEFKYEIERYVVLEPSEIQPEERVVKIFSTSIRKVTGRKPVLQGFKATCEMTHLVSSRIPTVIFGAGKLSQAHTVDEHVDIEEIMTASKIYAESIIKVLQP